MKVSKSANCLFADEEDYDDLPPPTLPLPPKLRPPLPPKQKINKSSEAVTNSQGTLTEGEGSIQLTSSLRQLVL